MKLFIISIFGFKQLSVNVWIAILAIIDRNIRVLQNKDSSSGSKSEDTIDVLHPNCSYYFLAWLGHNHDKVPVDDNIELPFEIGPDYFAPKYCLKKLGRYLTNELPKDRDSITKVMSLMFFTPFKNLQSNDILKACSWSLTPEEISKSVGYHRTKRKKLKKQKKKQKKLKELIQNNNSGDALSASDSENELDDKDQFITYDYPNKYKILLENITFDEKYLNDHDIQQILPLCIKQKIKIIITKHHVNHPRYNLLNGKLMENHYNVFRTSAKKSFELFFQHVTKKLSKVTKNGTHLQTCLAVVSDKAVRLNSSDGVDPRIRIKEEQMITILELKTLLSEIEADNLKILNNDRIIEESQPT